MKIIKRNLKDGRITLKIENLDDLWHLYNTVAPQDQVIAKTTRRVRIGDEEDRKQESVRKVMTLVLMVEDISFHSFSNRLRIKGKIIEGPKDYVSIGAYHTINVEIGSSITIVKEFWPKYLLDRLEKAQKTSQSTIALLVTIEDGNAELLLVADFGIKETTTIKTSLSRKRGAQKAYNSTMKEFFQEVLIAIKTIVQQTFIGIIIICGPGFVKDHFYDYLKTAKIKNLPPVIVEATNTIGIPAAKEILYRNVISKRMSELRIETETVLIEKVLEHVAKGDGLSTYGDENVARAIRYGAVQDLLITDKKLREVSDDKRRDFDQLIKETEQNRGKVYIVSTNHPAGEQLQNIGGIAAILRFKVHPDF